jgi:hypothetical protein
MAAGSKMATGSKATIIACGNPGAGKSSLLNILAGKPFFKSGISIGRGLTQVEAGGDSGVYALRDTPGLDDPETRKKAGEEISKALRNGGPHKVIFVVTENNGRIHGSQITTMQLILKAAPEIQSYGIIVNQCAPKIMRDLRDKQNAAKMVAIMTEPLRKANVPDGTAYWPLFLPRFDDMEGIESHSEEDGGGGGEPLDFAKLSKDGRFQHFLMWIDNVPTIQITPEKVKNVDTRSYDDFAKQAEAHQKALKENEDKLDEVTKKLEEAQNKQGGLFGMIGKALDAVFGL